MVVIACRSGSTICIPEIRNGTATVTIPVEYKGENITVEYSSVLDQMFNWPRKQKRQKPPKDYGRVPPRSLKK